MASANILDWDRSKAGTVELSDDVFGVPWRADLVQAVVRWQLACRRQGTHHTKTRDQVRGGGKKPYKQKGTGNARRGSQRSPLIRGGSVIFGPKPRDYSYTLPRKVKQLGLKVALSRLQKDGKLFIISDMSSDKGKTKDLASRLKKFGVKKSVLVDAKLNESFDRASRNLRNFRYYPDIALNVYDLLKYDSLILTKDSVASLTKRLTATGGRV